MSTEPIGRARRPGVLAIWIPITTAVLVSLATPAFAGFPTKKEALHRQDVLEVRGTWENQYRRSAPENRTFDMRGFVSTAVPGDEDTAISIGKDAPADRTAVVGAKILGQLDRSLTWQEVKSRYDGEGLRLEGTDWMAVFGLRVDNVADGFAPRTEDGTQKNSTDRFLLQRAYMTYIRDDCVEDDDLLSGVIRDSFFDGCSRFLSARPSSDESYANHDQMVVVKHTLVHMVAMPHEDSQDGDGTAVGSPFKWDESAGRIDLRHVIFLVDERPISGKDSIRFPDGTFKDVTLILGPAFDGDGDGNTTEEDWPVEVPRGVRITRNMGIWDRAVANWRQGAGQAAPDAETRRDREPRTPRRGS